MRAITGILALVLSLPAIAADDAALAHANELLSHAILFDGHNDLPWAVRSDETAKGDPAKYDLRTTKGQTDIARLRAGHVGAQFWSVYTPGESGKVFAKTGTLGSGDLLNQRLRVETKALGGYIEAKSGRKLAIAIIVLGLMTSVYAYLVGSVQTDISESRSRAISRLIASCSTCSRAGLVAQASSSAS